MAESEIQQLQSLQSEKPSLPAAGRFAIGVFSLPEGIKGSGARSALAFHPIERLLYTKNEQHLMVKVLASFIDDIQNPKVYSLWTLIEDVKLKDTNGLTIANARYTLFMNILRDYFSIAVSAEH